MKTIDDIKQYVLDNGMSELIDNRLDRYEPTDKLITLCNIDKDTHAYGLCFQIINFYIDYLKSNPTYVHKFVGYKGVKEFNLYMRFRLEHIKSLMMEVSNDLDDYTFYGYSFENAIPHFKTDHIILIYNDPYDDSYEQYQLKISEDMFLYGNDDDIKKLVSDTIIDLNEKSSTNDAKHMISQYFYNIDIYKAIDSYIDPTKDINSYKDSEDLIRAVKNLIKNRDN